MFCSIKKNTLKDTTSGNATTLPLWVEQKQNPIQFGGDSTEARLHLDASTEFTRGRWEGYQKGKEQHVGENTDHTEGKKWAKSCQNKSIWIDSNTD